MLARHKNKKAMKAYLLGCLDDRAAAALEQRYFTEPSWLAFCQMVETSLIQDYLSDRLPADQKARFEARYLATPTLRARIEEVRRESSVSAGGGVFLPRWHVVSLAAVAVVSAGIGYTWLRHPDVHPAPPVREVAVVIPPVEVDLTPGTTKGGTSGMAAFSVPSTGRARLRLELPGRSTPLQARVELNSLGAAGTRTLVWRTPLLDATLSATGAVLIFELDGNQIPPGDYVAEVLSHAGELWESYLFRVRK